MKVLNIILNGKKASKKLQKTMIKGLNDKKIRTEKGGYLFKIALSSDDFYLGILPEFNQGDRNYHYYIELPGNPEYFLTGSINPEGMFTLFFIPGKKELSDEVKDQYRNLYRTAAEQLLYMGLEKPGELDTVTQMLLLSSELFNPAPESLERLANLP